MKLILENWRKYLNEEMQDIHPKINEEIQNLLALPPDIVVAVEGFEEGRYKIKYINKKKRGEPQGELEIEAADYTYIGVQQNEGQCLDGYIVYLSNSTPGWGLLLYEVAIEFTSTISNGLTPDRSEVSAAATALWDKYADDAKRPDVIKKQLDIVHGKGQRQTRELNRISFGRSHNDMEQLTPGYEFDDCDQTMALKHAGYKWADAPHSKMYSKRTMPVMTLLKAAKRLKIK